jgi:Ni,Fe-hydrogenase III small subunit
VFDIFLSFLSKPKLTESFDLNSIKIPISHHLRSKLKKLGTKSIFIREIDAGSTNNCEHEIAALENPIYDLNRFGIKTVASPRHADMLLVTGPVSPGMETPLIKAYEATPDPKIVVAVGDGAISGRISAQIAGTGLKAVSECIPVDIEIPGNPPEPREIIEKLLGVLKSC